MIFSDQLNKNLLSAKVKSSADVNFMYFKKEMVVSGAKTNYLNINLKHQLCQITTILDASATGYNIKEISSVIGPHQEEFVFHLANGDINRLGDVSQAKVIFPELNTSRVESLPTIVNCVDNNSAYYTISSISIGELNQVNIKPFNDLVISPGVKYTIKLILNPTDEYLTYEDQSSVRINGKIWMRYNLGVDTSKINLDQNIVNENYHGNYYQWGRKTPVAKGTSSLVSNWDGSNNPPTTVWNNGTIDEPHKGSNDPCPNGFRVPTTAEFKHLISSVTSGEIGTWVNSPTNYGSAKVLKSKRNNSVNIIFPAQGWFGAKGNGMPYQSVGIDLRGNAGYYWTNEASALTTNLFKISENDLKAFTSSSNLSNRVVSYNIRCIAE